MKNFHFKKIISKKDNSIMGYYSDELNLFIVGKYETACGGCDSIKTQNEICDRIKKGLNKGWNVLFEGLLASALAERYYNLYKYSNDRKIDVEYIFLNTSLEQCFENVNKRRIKAGKEPKYPKTLEAKYHGVIKSRKNLMRMGIPEEKLKLLSSKESYKFILKSLRNKKQ